MATSVPDPAIPKSTLADSAPTVRVHSAFYRQRGITRSATDFQQVSFAVEPGSGRPVGKQKAPASSPNRRRKQGVRLRTMDSAEKTRFADMEAYYAELQRVCPELVDGLAIKGNKLPPQLSRAELTAILRRLPDMQAETPSSRHGMQQVHHRKFVKLRRRSAVCASRILPSWSVSARARSGPSRPSASACLLAYPTRSRCCARCQTAPEFTSFFAPSLERTITGNPRRFAAPSGHPEAARGQVRKPCRAPRRTT